MYMKVRRLKAVQTAFCQETMSAYIEENTELNLIGLILHQLNAYDYLPVAAFSSEAYASSIERLSLPSRN